MAGLEKLECTLSSSKSETSITSVSIQPIKLDLDWGTGTEGCAENRRLPQ